jgi:hypothetical protein
MSDLSWGKHIRNICGTALKKLGFIKRILGRYTDKKVKETCYSISCFRGDVILLPFSEYDRV